MKVALVAVVKEETHLADWIKWHRALGFDEVYLIFNDWNTDEKLDAIVTYHPGIAQQMKTYNVWINNYKDKYDFVAFFDADEYLYLVKNKSVKELLGEHSLGINWVWFGSKEADGEWDQGVVTRFKYRASKPDRHIKSIIRLQHNTVMNNPHHAIAASQSPEGKFILGAFNDQGSMDTAFIAHYFTQDKEYFAKKCARGRADTGKKFNHTMEEWDTYNVTANEVLDERLSNKFKLL